MTGADSRGAMTGGRWLTALAWAGLLAIVLAMHGRCVGFGFFMDDYAHVAQLRACGWSLWGLTDACRLELVGGVVDYWWLPETTLRFFRPLSFALMKVVYVLSDWSPAVQHAASVGWHFAACLLLWALLRRFGVPPIRSWCLTALFAIHPGHVVTVQWIACQTELMVTVLLLAATLCFARYRGWGEPTPALEARPSAGWAVATTLLFAAALGCRENAIMFPVVLLASEFYAPRSRRAAALKLYAILGVVALAYLGLRSYLLGGAELPPRPYVYPPGEPGFVRFLVDKLCYYVLGEFLLVPVAPIGGVPYLRTQPLWFYGGAAAVLLLWAAIAWRQRHSPKSLLAPAWMFAFALPVLPAFASPHHLYLPGVGWALAMAGLLGAIAGPARQVRTLTEYVRVSAASGLLLALAAGFVVVSHLFSYVAMGTGQGVEDRVTAEIADAPVPVEPGDTIYYANMPLIAHYTQLALTEKLGIEDVRVVALTWSPRVLGVATTAELTQLDERTLEVRVAGDAYFSGPLGHLIREATGQTVAERLSEPVRHEDFSVHLVEAAEDGVRTLRFVFDEPLSRPGVHLLWGSRTCWAFQVEPQPAPEAADGR